MPDDIEVGPAADLNPGDVTGAAKDAVGDAAADRFAVTRRCRHLRADLADGSIDDDGCCLVCPWHGAALDVSTGQATRGPQGFLPRCPDSSPRSRR